MNLKEIAQKVIQIEAEEIKNLSSLLTNDFDYAVQKILNCSGKVIISGMGKSGIVGKKISATLASTGTPSFFIHPGEAFHGDLGMIEKRDIVILISNSGETDEILKIIPFLNHQGNLIIAMTGNPESTLVKNSNLHLNISVRREACHLGLAPTSSTTATMVMGDALAITLMNKRDFQESNFAKFHPGGSLGKKLLQNVENVMKKDNLPIVKPEDSISEVIHVISNGKCGIAVVLKEKKIQGVISDGDIRRHMEKKQLAFFDLKASDVMTLNPCTIKLKEKLNFAEDVMNSKKINSLIVVNNDESFVGIVQRYDL